MNHRRIALNILLSSTLLISAAVQGHEPGDNLLPDAPQPKPGTSTPQAPQQKALGNDEGDTQRKKRKVSWGQAIIVGDAEDEQAQNTSKQTRKAEEKKTQRQAQLQKQLQDNKDIIQRHKLPSVSDEVISTSSNEIKPIGLLDGTGTIHLSVIINSNRIIIPLEQFLHININALRKGVVRILMEHSDYFMDWFSEVQRTALFHRFLNESTLEQRISTFTNRFIMDWTDWLNRFMGWFEEGQRPALLNHLIDALTLENFTSLLSTRSQEANKAVEAELEYLRGRIEAQKARETARGAARAPIQMQEIQRVGSEEHNQTFLREENNRPTPPSHLTPPLHSIGLQSPLERPFMQHEIPGDAVSFYREDLYLNSEQGTPRRLEVSEYSRINIHHLDQETIVAIAQNVDVLNQFGNYGRSQILDRLKVIRQTNQAKLVLSASKSAPGSGKKPPFHGGFGGGGSGQKF